MFVKRFQLGAMVTALAWGVSASEVAIDARDGIIPNDPDAEVVIATATGTGEQITLAESNTEIQSLTQRQLLIPAVVYIDGEQRLSLGLARMVADAQSLIIGKDKSVGEVVARTDGEAQVLKLQVDDSGRELEVNAKLLLASGDHTNRVEKLGAGNVRFGGDTYATVCQREGSIVYDNFLDGAQMVVTGSALYDFCSNMELSPELDGAFDVSAPLVTEETIVSNAVSGVIPVAEFQVNGGSAVRVKGASVNQPELSSNFDSMLDYAPDCGRVGSNSVGVLTFDGGAYTGKMVVAGGKAKYARGSLRLYNHSAMMNVTSTNATALAAGGYAHVDINEANYVAAGNWYGAEDGQLYLSIVDGSLSLVPETVRPTSFAFGGNDADAVMYVGANGRFDASSASGDEVYIPAAGAKNAYQTSVLAQGGELDFGSRTLHLRGNTGTGKTVIMVRDDATLKAAAVNGDVNASGNIRGYVAFDGGTFAVAGSKTYPFGSASGLQGEPTSGVCTFGSGLTLDISAGVSCTLPDGGTVSAPAGYGVQAVTMTAAFQEMTFVGPPVIRFVNQTGSGQGAAAVCDWDRDTGKVTAIRVLCRGWGYTETASVKAYVFYGSSDDDEQIAVLPVELSDNAPYAGGLTKTGDGTLILEGTNTYTGATTVLGGEVVMAAPDVIADSSRLDVRNHAIFNVGGGSAEFADYGGDGLGSVSNGAVTVTGLKIDFNRVATEDYYETLNLTNVEFAAGSKLQVLNAKPALLTDPSKVYLLYKVVGGVPSDFPTLDTVSYLLGLPETWAVAQRGTDEIVLKYIGGSIFIYY